MDLWAKLAAVLACAWTSVAIAHPGPRVWVEILNDKVLTYAGPYPPGDPSLYQPSRVFAQALSDEGGDIWTTDFPGFQHVPGGHVPAGTTFAYNITGPLLWYDPGDAARCPSFVPVHVFFSDAPPVPQMAVTNELFQTRYTSTGFVAGNTAFFFSGGAGDHNHLTYMLLGDGVSPGGGPEGIYALPLQLTAPGRVPSETFYLVLGKNASAGEMATAASVILFPRVKPDLNCDGRVDLADLSLLAACRTRAGVTMPTPAPGSEYCARADLDGDGDVDADDFGRYQRCYSGEAPSDRDCE